LNAEKGLEASTNQGTTDAKIIYPGKITATQAYELEKHIQTLIPKVDNLLQAMKNKKDKFVAAGPLVYGIAKSSINSLSSVTNNFSNALPAITPQPDQQKGAQYKSKIDSTFNSAEAIYT